MFSPNGRFLAYVSDATERREVYVRAFPSGGQWLVSNDGGTEPTWSADGTELFYGKGDQMLVVTVSTEGSFTAGAPKLLFEGRFDLAPYGDPHYDVSPDGQRFAMVSLGEEPAPARVQVVVNWLEELKRLVPEE
jgi:hypothetical protein